MVRLCGVGAWCWGGLKGGLIQVSVNVTNLNLAGRAVSRAGCRHCPVETPWQPWQEAWGETLRTAPALTDVLWRRSLLLRGRLEKYCDNNARQPRDKIRRVMRTRYFLQCTICKVRRCPSTVLNYMVSHFCTAGYRLSIAHETQA